jgi:hypothetical protein
MLYRVNEMTVWSKLYIRPLWLISRCKNWGSGSSGCEEFYLLGYSAVYPVERQRTFRRFLAWTTLQPRRRRRQASPKRRLTFKGLHGVISQKMELSFQDVSKQTNYSQNVTTGSPPLWSRGQSFWLQITRSWVRFHALPNFLRSSGSGTGSTQPREDNWVATWRKK